MKGDERFAAVRMNAAMFVTGVLIMALVAIAGSLFGGHEKAGVGDAIVVTARAPGAHGTDSAADASGSGRPEPGHRAGQRSGS